MLAIVYLLVTSLAGFAIATRAVPSAPAIVRVPAGFLLAVVFTSWTTYLIADGLSGQSSQSLRIGLIVSTLLGAAVLAAFGRSLRPRDLRLPAVDASVGAAGLALSWWLMHEHLRNKAGELMVSANTWGDMGLHIALSRSFSVGANYPTQYPFFAGEPIRYHFGFDFFAAILQKGGFSVLWSFNLPGMLGFTAMILFIFATARLLFSPPEPTRWWRDKGVWAGFVAAALLMTNQSLGWLRYVAKDGHHSIWHALNPSVLWKHQDYLTTGPYTDDRIAIYNTLNAYLTQMHLIVAVAVVLLLTYVLLWQLRAGDQLSKRLLIGVGVTFGVAFWLNGVVWLAAAVFFTMLLVVWGLGACLRAYREADAGRWAAARQPALTWIAIIACFAVPALLLGIPQALHLNGGGTHGGLKVHIGYLVCASTQSSCHADGGGGMNLLSLHDWWSFVQFWWLNEGVFIPLLVLAFFLGTRRDKKIITAATFIFFWGSLFQVGLDLGGQNHKVFNLWEAIQGLFVAFALVEIWTVGRRRLGAAVRGRRMTRVGARVVAIGLGVMLFVTGLVDFATIKNDFTVSVFGDQDQVAATDWIATKTPKRATFLTDYDQLYTAPTMAGRGIALGYSSWASSAGYDVQPREDEIKAIYTAPDRATACTLLEKSGLDYVLIGPQERSSPRFEVNDFMFSDMNPAVTIGNAAGQYRIYPVAGNC